MTNKTEYTRDEIASKLKQSIKKLLKEDKFLLENLANERSVGRPRRLQSLGEDS